MIHSIGENGGRGRDRERDRRGDEGIEEGAKVAMIEKGRATRGEEGNRPRGTERFALQKLRSGRVRMARGRVKGVKQGGGLEISQSGREMSAGNFCEGNWDRQTYVNRGYIRSGVRNRARIQVEIPKATYRFRGILEGIMTKARGR